MTVAGDENRTRTISLGSAAVTVARAATLASLAVPGDQASAAIPPIVFRQAGP